MEQPSGFELTLAEISARLLAASPDEFDAEMSRALERFVLFLDGDRGSLGRFRPDGTFQLSHHFAKPGIARAQASDGAELPRWVDQARSGRGFLMRRVEDIPPDWTKERVYVRKFGLKSSAMFPLQAGSIPIGMISVSSVTREHDWPETRLAQFQLFGEII